MRGVALAILAITVFSLAVMGVLLWRAPEGYEDEEGFHFGKPPEIDLQKKSMRKTPPRYSGSHRQQCLSASCYCRAMGTGKIDFLWWEHRFGLRALAGYLAGAMVYVAQYSLLH
jgi:hypothetical protein